MKIEESPKKKEKNEKNNNTGRWDNKKQSVRNKSRQTAEGNS